MSVSVIAERYLLISRKVDSLPLRNDAGFKSSEIDAFTCKIRASGRVPSRNPRARFAIPVPRDVFSSRVALEGAGRGEVDV